MSTKPNVLLIVVDQWRGEALGCLGAAHAQTPNLDRLAARGVTFARHFAQAAPCGPARASLLTGQYLMNHRVVTNGVPLDRRHAHLARIVRRAGWDPSIVGYTTTTADPSEVGFDDTNFTKMGEIGEGWTPVADFEENNHRRYVAWAKRCGHADPAATIRELWAPADGGTRPGDAPAAIPTDLSDSRWSTEHALDFLSERQGEPWFLHLGYLRPHPPFTAPAPYHLAIDPRTIPKPKRAATAAAECGGHPAVGYFHGLLPMSGFMIGGEGKVVDLSDTDLAALRRHYYGMIAEVDAEIGRVLDFLEARGELDRTLIIFTSDHGEQLGDHYLLGKCGFYDESYHIPLIVADPRPDATATRGTIVKGFSESVDIMPTILDWLGLETPISCDGASLLPLIRAEPGAKPKDAAHFEFSLRLGFPYGHVKPLDLDWRDSELTVLRTERFKYVHFTALPPVLFDLERDPDEMVNRADDPAYRETALALTRRMLSWRMRHADRTLSRYNASKRGLLDLASGRIMTERGD
jgi:arylsulfatase A-like enzyme